MVLKPVLTGVLLLVGSTYSLAASTLIVTQQATPSNLIGAALPQVNADTFTDRTGYPSTYSESLNYSTGPIIDTSGNPVAQGHASTSLSFDLPRGEFKLFSESLLPSQGPTVGGLSAESSVRLIDHLTIHSPTASSTNPTFLTLRLEAEGEISLSDPIQQLSNRAGFGTVLIARNETQGALASGNTSSFCAVIGTSDCLSGGDRFFNGGAFATINANLTDGGKDEVTLRVPLYEETSMVQLNLNLRAFSTQGVADFSHTAKLFIDVPGGSFTSESGIMSAIPEPETYAMFLVGLGLMGFMARRRKTS